MASVGLWGAFFMSLRFMTPGHAQTPNSNQTQKIESPASGDLPPEFLQEPQQGVPPPNGGDGKIPPPPTQPPVPPPTHAEAARPPTQPEIPSNANSPGGTSPRIPPTAPMDDSSAVQLEAAAPVIPQFASDDQYTYDPKGHRDPFRPFKTYHPPSPTGTTTTGPINVIDSSDPLQRWDLDRFAVVAIMWEIRLPKAMVKDPDGKMYMVSKSTKIGRNSGQVVAIREGEVVVVESIDNEGVQTKEVKILELKK
jgi:type IV pilus assembly protein PilP